MQPLLQSFLAVALTEMGDKTQLLALVLTSRFRQPWTIMAGILTATVLNHLLAATVGVQASHMIPAQTLRWILAALFFGFAAWILVPDKDEDSEHKGEWGAFVTTAVTFFLAEMGDKTQLSTVAMAAKYQNLLQVTTGTTLGMLFSDGLAVYFGDSLTQKFPMKWIRIVACLLFVGFGVGLLLQD